MKYLLIVLMLFDVNAHAQTVNTYMSKGNEHYLRLEWEQAETQFRQAVQKQPSNAQARYNLANALMQQKKYKAAIETYETVNTKDPSLNAAVQYNTGVSYSKQKDLPASIEAYKAALRINPNDKEARENLQKALSELRQQQSQQNQDKNKSGGGGMSQNEADKKLKQLQQKEKDLKQKMQQGGGKGAGGGKDW